ncbi:hypothetical protein PHET_00958 [Paragonimus heterotremus]|uniref:Uncharacterized protein n=1 Tax=Paragonimus heterotremus TaxID=100268 RepID=A0A8J4TMY3_9TREM|nr:hypothetical protein PHET_00958 [Paragonimus heterotremus]
MDRNITPLVQQYFLVLSSLNSHDHLQYVESFGERPVACTSGNSQQPWDGKHHLKPGVQIHKLKVLFRSSK